MHGLVLPEHRPSQHVGRQPRAKFADPFSHELLRHGGLLIGDDELNDRAITCKFENHVRESIEQSPHTCFALAHCIEERRRVFTTGKEPTRAE
jgi:hypothetical protein